MTQDDTRKGPPTLADYGVHTRDKVRYGDTDRQGHVNNAVFATFLETGRVEVLYDPEEPLADEGASFVIARLALDFRAEIHWPGEVEIGTRIQHVGRSSITLEQALFQGETCVATAETVIVQMDDSTRRSRPLRAETVERLRGLGPEDDETGS